MRIITEFGDPPTSQKISYSHTRQFPLRMATWPFLEVIGRNGQEEGKEVPARICFCQLETQELTNTPTSVVVK